LAIFDLNVYIDRIDGHHIDCNIDVDREEVPNGIKSPAESFMRYDFADDTKEHAYFDNDEIVHLSDDLDKGELYTIDAFSIKRYFDIASSKNENYQSLLKKWQIKALNIISFLPLIQTVKVHIMHPVFSKIRVASLMSWKTASCRL
jgi:hypothetical protein